MHTQAHRNDDLENILRDKMAEILELIAAIAAEVPDTDLKLAEMLEGEPEVVRMAIVHKLRELLREKAAEKESELERIIESQRRVVVERQRNIFMQWLQWIMSEETLRKIQMLFVRRPGLERSIEDIGQQLAAKGVLQQLQPEEMGKTRLGELNANVAPAQGFTKGQDKGRGNG